MINSTQHIKARIKETAEIIPVNLSADLYERTEIKGGTSSSNTKPMAEPTPCMLEAVVIVSLLSFTLKKQVKIQAPTAKIAIQIVQIKLNPNEDLRNASNNAGIDRKNKTPAANIHELYNILTGLLTLPNELNAIFMWLYLL